jgi:23S rRNA pseudouridine955/2504/2580 synthase
MREYVIDDKKSGVKCFSFLKKQVGENVKNSDLFKIIRKGIVRVNGKKIESSTVLQSGDILTLYLAEEYFNKKKNASFPIYHLEIVYEDSDILVINKERGVLVHSDGVEYRKNLVEYVKGYLYRKNEYSSESLFTPTFCNRLDFNTSGIVIAAKNHQALQRVTAAFRDRQVEKRYYALVFGKLDKAFLISSKMEERLDQKNKMKCIGTQVTYDIPQKESFLKENQGLCATKVEPILFNAQASLVEVSLWTGKKHQIRAQMNSVGFPLLGDLKYFSRDSSEYSQTVGFDGYFLHSCFLGLPGFGAFHCMPDESFMNAAKSLFSEKEINKFFNKKA